MRWIRNLFRRTPPPPPPPPPTPEQRALALVKAVDAGGLPLHPARVNDIARQLGLPVSKTERVGDTVERIRAEMQRRR